MIKTILIKLSYLFNYFLLLIILFCSINVITANNLPPLKNESDSIKMLLITSKNDTYRLLTLNSIFWKYYNINFDRAKYYGEWAYNEFKNSKNKKILNSIYTIKGVILMQKDKLDSANYFFTECLKFSINIRNLSGISAAYWWLGFLNDVSGNHDVAINYFKRSLNIRLKINDLQFVYYSLEWLADMYIRSCEYDSAEVYVKKRLDVVNRIPDKMNKIFTYNFISRYYREMNNNIKSTEYMNYVLTEAEKKQSDLKADVFYIIGEYFLTQKKNRQIALEYCKKGIEKDSTNFYVYQLLSDIYREEGKVNLAFENALNGLKKASNRVEFALGYSTLGKAYKLMGKTDLAISCLKEAYKTNYNFGNKIYFYEYLFEIADLLLKDNNPTEALAYYGKTLELSKKYDAKKAIILTNLKIGNFYQLIQQPRLAENYYLSALRMTEKIKNISLLKIIADTLNQFYLKRNDVKSAYKYLTISQITTDSLSKIERDADIAGLLMKFEFEKIKKENEAKQALSNEEIKRQKILRNFLLITTALLVMVGFVIFTNYKRKKRDNKLLTEKNDQIEEKNQEIQAQVEEITAKKNEIERISNELHESDAMKLRFFSNISHELRTPLTLIINPVQKLLESGRNDGEYKKQLENIYKNAQKLLDLTNQILDLQKLDAGKLQLNLEKNDIIKYCLQMVSSFESLCDKKNNVIKFIANHHSVITLFDKDKIGKILVNLLSNALKFCYEDSAIEICLEISGNHFYFSVADKGIGIPGNQIDNVFKRYYQVPSNNRAEGTGIGLAYVKELVGFMNGKVTIDSKEKKGTKVNIYIPVNEVEIKDSAEFNIEISNIKKRVTAKEFDTSAFIKENQNESSVLIVEDNEELMAFIADLLRTDFIVYMAKDGQEGIQAALQYIPDIIISDVMMPNMDGLELCAKLKKDERTSHIPIILLTAKDSIQSSLEGYKTGADDYIIKPFDNELLKLKVNNIIATHEAVRKQFDFKSIISTDNLKFGDTDKKFMKKCLEVIDKHIGKPEFSVDMLAEELAFSSRNFYRKIKALTNQTPAELIRVYRLQYARQLLQNTKMKVFEIAAAVGYEDVKRFGQAFKKQFGFPPSESLKNTPA